MSKVHADLNTCIPFHEDLSRRVVHSSPEAGQACDRRVVYSLPEIQ